MSGIDERKDLLSLGPFHHGDSEERYGEVKVSVVLVCFRAEVMNIERPG